jgi:hypothetical protein
MDAHTIEDFAKFLPKKFHAFLGKNKSHTLDLYFGPKISSFSSPLVRCLDVRYITIHPYNGASADHRGISAELKGLVRTILGRPLTDEDLKVDVDEIVSKKMPQIMALLKILARESFIIPGPLEGGNVVYYLVQKGIDEKTLEEKIKEFRATAPVDPLKRWEEFDDAE